MSYKDPQHERVLMNMTEMSKKREKKKVGVIHVLKTNRSLNCEDE